SYRDGASGLDVLHLRVGGELAQLRRAADERREGSPVAGGAPPAAKQLEREGRLFGAHRVVVADRQDGEVGLVEAADERHVAEATGVAGEVNVLPPALRAH